MSRRGPVPFEGWLLGAYLAWWTAWSVAPRDRFIWFAENLLVFLVVPLLILTRGWLRFSRAGYACIAAFLFLHAVGAHYGYTQVPLDWGAWGFARNHSDRVSHFAFGLLAVVPLREVLSRKAGMTGAWLQVLSVAVVLALGAAFEILEWLAVVVGHNAVEITEGYLGTQGDPFDAIKDMAFALLGASLTVTGTTLLSRRKGPPGRSPREPTEQGFR